VEPKVKTGLAAAGIVAAAFLCCGLAAVFLLVGPRLPTQAGKPQAGTPQTPGRPRPEPPDGGTYQGFDSETYLSMFDDLDARTHVDGKLGLQIIGDRAAVRGLAKRLKGKGEEHRLGAAQALGIIGPAAHEALPGLRDAARSDPSAAVRKAAEHAVSSIDR
jgi:hypothetical protein